MANKNNNNNRNGYKGDFYTKIPNQILQPLLMIKLQSYEIRILLAIARKTYGFNKDKDYINQKQLKKLTGIKQPHISRTLKSLLGKKMIIKNDKELAIQKNYKLWDITEKETLKNIPYEVYNASLQADKNIPGKVYKYTKEGIKNISGEVYTKNTIKKTYIKKNIDSSDSSDLIKNFYNEKKDKKEESKKQIKEIVNYLNSKTNKNFRSTTAKTIKLIKARLNEGYILGDFKKIIDIKTKEWLNSNFEKYLRPETLFGNKFEGYLNENKDRYTINKIKVIETEDDEFMPMPEYLKKEIKKILMMRPLLK